MIVSVGGWGQCLFAFLQFYLETAQWESVFWWSFCLSRSPMGCASRPAYSFFIVTCKAHQMRSCSWRVCSSCWFADFPAVPHGYGLACIDAWTFWGRSALDDPLQSVSCFFLLAHTLQKWFLKLNTMYWPETTDCFLVNGVYKSS